MPENVRTERRADGVAVLRIDRPPLNALSRAVLDELESAARELGGDPEVKAVVVLGGAKAFAAGADISEFGGQTEARDVGKQFRAAFDALGAIPRPVIAAINGVALGGGLELALACDLRIAADSARVGQPEILLGIIPGAGATQRLPRLVGPARAKELIWSGRQVEVDEALAVGAGHRRIDLGDDAACNTQDRGREIHRHAETDEAAPIGRGDLKQRHVDRQLSARQELRYVLQ